MIKVTLTGILELMSMRIAHYYTAQFSSAENEIYDSSQMSDIKSGKVWHFQEALMKL